MAEHIPPEILQRNPLITDKGLALLNALRESAHAPRWNHAAGDKIDAKDLEALKQFAKGIDSAQRQTDGAIPEHLINWILDRHRVVPAFRMRILNAGEVENLWSDVPTMSREDIAVTPELFVPDDADLNKLIVYRTAGTTGHALLVPHSARAAGMYQPLIEAGLAKHGVKVSFSSDKVACFLVCAQARTVTYPTVLSAWNGAGFAKINLKQDEWPAPESIGKYFEEFQPAVLTGDPISFAEMLRLDIRATPSAMVSTAVAMSPALKARLQSHYGCPVIEWYSLTETGPIGYGCPQGFGYHLLPPDIFVECLDANQQPVPTGERGEITVTGGRNPYLPLLRYRTGDWGRLVFGTCRCGSSSPLIADLEGRQPVVFRNQQQQLVNSVDISAALREFPIVQHEFVQHADLSIELTLRPISRATIDEGKLQKELKQLFGESTPIAITLDSLLGDRSDGGKTLPYRSEFELLED